MEAPSAPPSRRQSFPLLFAFAILCGLASAAYNVIQSNELTAASETNAQLLAQLSLGSRPPSPDSLIAQNQALRIRITELESQLAKLGPQNAPATSASPLGNISPTAAK